MPVPVTILTGFLGAGKTTLLNDVLRARQRRRVGVLVNDFGAVAIDARLVASIEGDAISLTNGCVCCTMQGDLRTSVLKMLAMRNAPEYILLEASGISDPIGILSAFRTSALRDVTRIDSVVTVVDAEHARNPRLDQQLIQDQIRAADIVIVNKTDLVTQESLQNLCGWVRGIVPSCRIMPTVNSKVPLDVILGTTERTHTSRDPIQNTASTDLDHPGDLRHPYDTWSIQTSTPLAYRKVRARLAALPPEIFRAKGLLLLADAPLIQFVAQVVGRRVSIEPAGRWEKEEPGTAMVFIGETGRISVDSLNQLFRSCGTDAFPLMSSDNLRGVRDLRSLALSRVSSTPRYE